MREERSVVLLVRSVLVPDTHNALINPRHEEAARVARLATFPYPLDPCLARRALRCRKVALKVLCGQRQQPSLPVTCTEVSW